MSAEYSIGAQFHLGSGTFVVKEELVKKSCEGCVFFIKTEGCLQVTCLASGRSDNTNVIFKEIT